MFTPSDYDLITEFRMMHWPVIHCFISPADLKDMQKELAAATRWDRAGRPSTIEACRKCGLDILPIPSKRVRVPRKPKVIVEKVKVDKYCEVCNTKLEGPSPRQFCSAGCRLKAWRKKQNTQ